MWFQTILRRRAKDDPGGASDVDPDELLLSPRLWGRLDRLRLRAGRFLPGANAGQRPSPRRKPSADFREHRQYVPGDDVRFVDWRASARHEQIFLRQGEQPHEISVYLLLDVSASMAWGEPSKRTSALRVAAALGYLALSHDDRLTLLPIGNQAKPLGPIKGKGQFPGLLNYLKVLEFGGEADLMEQARQLRQLVGRGGLVFVLSDLLGSDLAEALQLLPAPTWEVNVLHLLHPSEINPALKGDYEIVDIETGQAVNYDIDPKAVQNYSKNLQTWLNQVELSCIDHKASYTLIPTGGSLEREVIPQLRRLQIIQAE
jgi:uncharacterized protein (DUF58 family)